DSGPGSDLFDVHRERDHPRVPCERRLLRNNGVAYCGGNCDDPGCATVQSVLSLGVARSADDDCACAAPQPWRQRREPKIVDDEDVGPRKTRKHANRISEVLGKVAYDTATLRIAPRAYDVDAGVLLLQRLPGELARKDRDSMPKAREFAREAMP